MRCTCAALGTSGRRTPGYIQPYPHRSPEQAMQRGYVDVGFAAVQGNGSSFAADDRRVPADYAVDAFAPAVSPAEQEKVA